MSDPTDDAPSGDAEPDPMAEGVEQFQRAALDALNAARAMLDAAESMVRQPGAFDQLSSTFAGLARAATDTVRGFSAGVVTPDPPDEDDLGDDGFHAIVVD